MKIRLPLKILYENLKEFLNRTTVHGLQIVAKPKLHFLERVLWLIIVGLAAAGAINLSLSNWTRFSANPTVVSIQKDFRNWNNAFPSATACYLHKTNDLLIDNYIMAKWKINDTHPKYNYYVDFIKEVANISYLSLDRLKRFVNDDDLKKIDFLDLAAKVHPYLTGTLVTFDTKRKTNWKLIISEMGVCFTMNSKFSNLLAFDIKGVTDLVPKSDDYILRCHYLNGLCYARYDSDPLAPIKIYIHSYLDVVHHTADPPLYVKESEELEINYRMEETVADGNLRYLRPSQRKCRFDDEPISDDLPVYSNSICHIVCRYKLVMRLCGCRPFFYHNMAGKSCDIKGLVCAAEHIDQITKPPSELGCDCPQPCDIITYLPLIPKKTVWQYGYFDQRITFRWGLIQPTTKYHRDVLFGVEDLVVSIGGISALFLGVSFISLIEIILFLVETTLCLFCPRISRKKYVSTPKPPVKTRQKLYDIKQPISSINLGDIPLELPHRKNYNRGYSK